MKLAKTLAAIVLFGVSFGYVEAAVVVYLRAVCAPIREQAFADKEHNEMVPCLRLADLQAAGPGHVYLLRVELGRELATLVMLAAAGAVMASSVPQWLAGFMIAFGVWDIFYYVCLKLLVDWPRSLRTWDVLFLLPVPWVGPVVAPVIVSLSMIAAGVAILGCESAGRPISFRWFHWAALVAGGLLIIAACCWDWRNTLAGGWPNPFHWPLFAAGEAVGGIGFLDALRRGVSGNPNRAG